MRLSSHPSAEHRRWLSDTSATTLGIRACDTRSGLLGWCDLGHVAEQHPETISTIVLCAIDQPGCARSPARSRAEAAPP